MQKKKVKIIFSLLKLIARTWIINIPAVFILLVLMMLGQLGWLSALIALFCFWTFSAIIIFFIFKDLDDFILYLNKISEGVSEEFPKFKKSLFSSRRLANAYQAVSSLWQNQALSDSSILDNLPDPLIMTNEKQEVVFINQAGIKIFGKKCLGQNIFHLFQISPIAANKKPLFFKWKKEKGEQVKYYQVRLDKLAYPTRLKAIYAFILHDITSFESFQQQQVDFFANASHELKTPLAIISGAIETLQGPAQNDTKAQKTFLTMIANQTQHMTLLVQDLLNLAHLKQKKTNLEKIEVRSFISDLIQTFMPKALQKQQRLIYTPPVSPLWWVGSKLDLKYMIQNLFDNALKYGPEKAIITLTLTPSKKHFSVKIHNTGSYIPKEFQQAVFERFYRLNTPFKQEGSGLGLNIVAYLVKKYHGQISVQSHPQKGTSFNLVLPLSS